MRPPAQRPQPPTPPAQPTAPAGDHHGTDTNRLPAAPVLLAIQRRGRPRRQVIAGAALYRSRTEGLEERRSAVVTLAGILEQRRELLRTELLTKDDGMRGKIVVS